MPQAIADVPGSLRRTAPVMEMAQMAPPEASWVDDMRNALGSYFKAYYPPPILALA